MKNSILLAMLLCVANIFAQNHSINGYVYDALTGEKLIGANVYDLNSLKGCATNNYGFFSMKSIKNITLKASFIGYKTYTNHFSITNDTIINIALYPSSAIDEVLVKANQVNNLRSSEMGTLQIPMKSADKLPVIFGEADILKTLQLLPGIQGSEAMSGMYVRGGGPDQNLIILDGVPVYNANHLFGFFSVFNSDAIQSVKVTKGAFPARYGGRLSSVIDIRMKEGNNHNIKGSASVGLISSKFLINGPINNNLFFIISARRTYADLLAAPYFNYIEKSENYDKYKTGYYFYDLNTKVNYKFNDKHRIYLSLYSGKDKYNKVEKKHGQEVIYDENAVPEWPHLDTLRWKTEDKTQLWWKNTTSALRWNFLINNKLFLNTTATFSYYQMQNYDLSAYNINNNSLKYNSSIQDIGIKSDFDYYPSTNHSIKFGISETYHTFNPGTNTQTFTNTNDSENNILNNSKQYSHEFAAYFEDDINLLKILKANIGLRWCGFKSGDKFYNSFEPRISSRLLLTNQCSFKFAYAQMHQYVNLLTNSNIGLPFDLWVPATDAIKPQKSHQVSIGSVYSINSQIDISLETFYKEMTNLIEYKEGASFLSKEKDWQTKVTQGNGFAYGIELLLMKQIGKTTGWIGYTWSKSERQFNTKGEEISFGQRFPYKYDRRHDISIVVSHKFSKKIDISGTWVYGTGNATTLAYTAYPSIDQEPHSSNWKNDVNEIYTPNIEYITKRNNYRMPSYHRLDASINFRKDKKWGKQIWNVSIYNIYNRQNPFMIEWDTNPVTNKKRLMQYSIFQITPSISYKIIF